MSPPLPTEAALASRALALENQRAPLVVLHALQIALTELEQAGIDGQCEHPACQVLIAQLAELAGLQFHWPRDAVNRCVQIVATERAKSTCLSPAANG